MYSFPFFGLAFSHKINNLTLIFVVACISRSYIYCQVVFRCMDMLRLVLSTYLLMDIFTGCFPFSTISNNVAMTLVLEKKKYVLLYNKYSTTITPKKINENYIISANILSIFRFP